MKEENNIKKNNIISEEENTIVGYPSIEYTFYEPTSNKNVTSRVITVFGKGITFQFKCQTPSNVFNKFNPIFSDIINTFTIIARNETTKQEEKNKGQRTVKDTSSKNKCHRCGYIMDEPDWRCPECYHEFEEDIGKNSPSTKLSPNHTTDKNKEFTYLSWTKTILIGFLVGAIGGLLAGLNFGIVGFIILVIIFLLFGKKLKPRSRMIVAILIAIVTGGALGTIIRIINM